MGLNDLAAMDDDELAAFLAAHETAWQINIQAVQDAMAECRHMRRRQAEVELGCGQAARARNPNYPVLTEDEIDAVTRARAAARLSWDDLTESRALFKAGVTDDQFLAVCEQPKEVTSAGSAVC